MITDRKQNTHKKNEKETHNIQIINIKVGIAIKWSRTMTSPAFAYSPTAVKNTKLEKHFYSPETQCDQHLILRQC